MDETTTVPEIKMDPAVKTAWLAALRSGEYRQGTGLLRSDTAQFCCLGVLCEVAVTEGVIAPPRRDNHGQWLYADTAVCAPPERVRDWAGLHDIEMGVRGLPDYSTPIEALMTFNDRQRLSFKEIADWIEEHL